MERFFGISIILISAVSSFGLQAATIRVPQDQPTIQAGINAAVSGDTVLIADGTYTGTGNKEIEYFGKAITVISENGSGMCIIDCETSGRGFYFRGGEGNGSVLDGLTIRNGAVSGGYVSNRGGGIRVGGGASPVIRNCVITQNSATGMGAGIYVVSNSTVIENCVISNNQGVGLYHDGQTYGGPLTVQGCMIESNIGYGVYSSKLNMTDSIVRQNLETGVRCTSGTITNCLFDRNQGSMGGGLYIGTGTVKTSTFEDNMSRDEGGGIYCGSPTPMTIGGSPGTGNTFSGNSAGAGADLYCYAYQSGTVNAGYNTFIDGCASDYYISPLEVFDLTGCTFNETPLHQDVFVSPTGDDASDGLTWGTAFQTLRRAVGRVQGTVEQPITIHVAAGQYSPSLTGERFPVAMSDFVRIEGEGHDQTEFDAEYSAGVLVASFDEYCAMSGIRMINGLDGVYTYYSSTVFEECDVLACQGTGIKVHSGNITLVDCDISDHSAYGVLTYGSQVSMADCEVMHNAFTGLCNSESTLTLSECMILDNNMGTYYGGGIFLDGSTATISGSLIWGNTTSDDGGGIACTYDSILTLSNCVFAGNSAGRDGGALSGHYDSVISIMNCTFTGNTAGRNGGAMGIMFDCSVTAWDCIFWNDTPDEISNFLSEDITVTYSVVQGGYAGEGNIDTDPLLVSGPAGDFYLSQTGAGQAEDSPCLNAGSVPSEDACFDMSHGTVCMDTMTTRTDDETDMALVDIGFHYFPGDVATPTPAPTQVPTASPTPTPHPEGVDMILNATVFHGGEPFKLRAACYGPPGQTIDLYVILDVMGLYWFYPDWTQTPCCDTFSLQEGSGNYRFVLDFVWPSGDLGQGDGIRFWGAMCDAGTADLIGEIDFVTFGWR